MANRDDDFIPSEDHLRAFVGRNAGRYWRRWRWYIQHDRRSAGLLWPPFFLSVIWFLYRRMYKEVWVPFALAGLVAVAEVAVEELYFVRRLGVATPPRLVETVGNFVLASATSWAGSALYLRRFRSAVRDARERSPLLDSQLELLRERGGTSAGGLVVGIAITLGLAVLTYGLAG